MGDNCTDQNGTVNVKGIKYPDDFPLPLDAARGKEAAEARRRKGSKTVRRRGVKRRKAWRWK